MLQTKIIIFLLKMVLQKMFRIIDDCMFFSKAKISDGNANAQHMTFKHNHFTLPIRQINVFSI